jgi:hypothetical protein
MAYTVKRAAAPNAPSERLETATACLERVKALQAEHEPDIGVYDREGRELTVLELERLSAKELI